ncbi:helix-turn-helix domain-containing protein [Levilactobacillus tujiorum]|uniref:Transposase n=1 Tax=Levilactobacillus tujiorum TaxID=2912243 RepID=A0ABX1L8J0_9LACO|nr:helix-turn-helix domain-containing protein [Levilactobacillus tujiorum]MCH5465655.1 helix-turn-helix domain-containing protein [Levilactobacillus tujiorum]NLR12739.1 transposase [Lactobacillus sp. HBUAS51387]NLR30654.1 transposase [Levilactobacillus tujiorum]
MGRRGSRYTVEEKYFYVKLVLDEGNSYHAIQREYGIRHTQVEQWVERYRKHGLEGLKRRPTNQAYTRDFKVKLINIYLEGQTSYRKLAKQFNIPNAGIIYQWVNLYTSGKLPKTTRRLVSMNGRKTTQLERIEVAQWVIENDFDYNKATQKFKISYNQAYNWTKKFQDGGAEALQDRRGKSKADKPNLTETEQQELRIKQLEARNEHLALENKLLKKLDEIERTDAVQSKNIVPFRHSHKKRR